MNWTHLLVAFLAGYGFMTLLLWLLSTLAAGTGRPRTASALILAGRDAGQIEGLLRLLHLWLDSGNLVEIVATAEADGEARAIIERLTHELAGLRLLAPGTTLAEAAGACRGESIWLIDPARLDRSARAPLAPPWTIFARDRNRIARRGRKSEPPAPGVSAG